MPAAPQVSICIQNRTWTPDPARLVCQEQLQGKVLLVLVCDFSTLYYCFRIIKPNITNTTMYGIRNKLYLSSSFLCTANCGVPVLPHNGTIVNYIPVHWTGQLFTTSATQGLVRQVRCQQYSGTWSPDPADVTYCREVGMHYSSYWYQQQK